MFRARHRVASVATFATLVAAAAATALVSAPTAPAADAAAMLSTTPLFLTERFNPSAGPGRAPLTGNVVPERLVALRGEREGMQFAFQNTSGANLMLAARVVPDASLAGQMAGGAINWELLRSAFVNVPRASTRLDRGAVPGSYTAGVYQDALPPFRNQETAGQLSVAPGTWGGAVAIAAVRTDAAPGVYTGSIELYDPAANDTVHVRQPFSLDVRSSTLLQNGAPGSFKTVMHVEGDQYWLQNRDMRNGAAAGFPAAPDRMLQLQGLMSFLDSRGVSLNEQPFGGPSATGAFTCSYTSSPGNLPAFSFLEQIRLRYFGTNRDINPAAPQFPTRMFPSETDGCDPSRPDQGYNAKIDKYNTPSIKQDDVLDPRAGEFFKTAAAAWTAGGFFGRNAYVKNPFDEPSDVTPAMRYQYSTQVPKANQLLRAALGKRAKIVLADWPRDTASRKVCRVANGHRSCTTLSGDGFSNKRMWDGRGTDDVDVWLAPFSRLFGRPVGANLKPFNVNRQREYADRLDKIKKLPGREVWAYNFFTGNAAQPQLTIDAPATDARMNYWVLANEGHTGLFVSNTILGWGSEEKTNSGGTRRKGNPWDGATYFQHGTYGQAAGWGTFLYPGYHPAVGLRSEADRNGPASRPVTTLRMEGLRDGQEDANLMRMYRTKVGAAGVKAVTKPIFPGTYKQLPKQLGQVMFPAYNNTNNLALRLETQRRTMIDKVGGS